MQRTVLLDRDINMTENASGFLIIKEKTIRQAMSQLSEVGEKQLFVVDDDNRLIGALSDGDIRKWILKGGNLYKKVDEVCNKFPKYVSENYDIEDVKQIMLEEKIESIPVINKDRIVKDILVWDKVFSGEVKRHREKIDMPVVIMAGGKGSRLDPYTKILPKPLIPIGEKPIIELIMDKFNEFGIKDFFISINHKAKMIKSYFEETNGEYNITYIEESMPLGTIGSLSLVRKEIDNTVLVTNCDVIVDADYVELVRFHKDRGYSMTLVACYRHYTVPYGVCEIANGGSLKAIKEKPKYDLLINAGMYIMNKEILSLIPENRCFDSTDLINAAQSASYPVGVFPIHEKDWLDVGEWDEYRKTVRKLSLDID